MIRLFLECKINEEDLSRFIDGLNKAINLQPMVRQTSLRVIRVTSSGDKYLLNIMDYSNIAESTQPKFETRQYTLDELINS